MFEYLGASIEVSTPFHTSSNSASSTKVEAIIAAELFATDEERLRSEHAAFGSPVGVLTQSVLYLLTLDVGRSVVAATPTFSNNCRNMVSSPRFCASAHVAPQIARRQRNWLPGSCLAPAEFLANRPSFRDLRRIIASMCIFGLHFRVYATFAPSNFLILATGIIRGAISSNFCGARIALDRSNWDIVVARLTCTNSGMRNLIGLLDRDNTYVHLTFSPQ
jgi:hypothetical protein